MTATTGESDDGRGPGQIASRVPGPAPRVWYDMTGLAAHRGGITGIQRVQLGIVEEILRSPRWSEVGLCVFEKKRGFRPMRRSLASSLLAGLGAELSWRDRHPPRRTLRRLQGWVRRRKRGAHPFASGDALLNLGFATYPERHRPLVREILAESGVRYVGFVYDLLTVSHPEWWDPEHTVGNREWFVFTGRESHTLLCCSEATRRDAEAFYAAEGIAVPPIQTVRLADQLPAAALAAARDPGPPPPRPYVLYVSTLDVRKNHLLLIDVWRRLVERHGVERVPDLLLVGRVGYGGEAVLGALERAGGVQGRIRQLQGVSDVELSRLYANCLFTVYPSVAEGWGLPIGESLGYGKYCVASASSSIPEIGGDLLDYHEPGDAAAAAALVERAAFDPAFLAAREAEICRRYRAHRWGESLAEMMQAIEERASGRALAAQSSAG